MGDHPRANPRFAAPQDDGVETVGQSYFDESVITAALARWVQQFGLEESCAMVPVQRSECRRAG